MNARPDRHPFFQPHVPTLKEKAKFLSVQSIGLSEPMIEVDQGAIAIANRAIDLFFDVRSRPKRPLRGHDPPVPEPPGVEIEEVNAMLNKNAATLLAVPEPMLRPQ